MKNKVLLNFIARATLIKIFFNQHDVSREFYLLISCFTFVIITKFREATIKSWIRITPLNFFHIKSNWFFGSLERFKYLTFVAGKKKYKYGCGFRSAVSRVFRDYVMRLSSHTYSWRGKTQFLYINLENIETPVTICEGNYVGAIFPLRVQVQ